MGQGVRPPCNANKRRACPLPPTSLWTTRPFTHPPDHLDPDSQLNSVRQWCNTDPCGVVCASVTWGLILYAQYVINVSRRLHSLCVWVCALCAHNSIGPFSPFLVHPALIPSTTPTNNPPTPANRKSSSWTGWASPSGASSTSWPSTAWRASPSSPTSGVRACLRALCVRVPPVLHSCSTQNQSVSHSMHRLITPSMCVYIYTTVTTVQP